MTKEEAIKILKTADFSEDYTVTEIQQALDMAIKALKQEQPKMGWWIFHKSFDNGYKNCNECIECSQCHTWFGYDCYNKTPYCPNCGSRMKGK